MLSRPLPQNNDSSRQPRPIRSSRVSTPTTTLRSSICVSSLSTTHIYTFRFFLSPHPTSTTVDVRGFMLCPLLSYFFLFVCLRSIDAPLPPRRPPPPSPARPPALMHTVLLGTIRIKRGQQHPLVRRSRPQSKIICGVVVFFEFIYLLISRVCVEQTNAGTQTSKPSSTLDERMESVRRYRFKVFY